MRTGLARLWDQGRAKHDDGPWAIVAAGPGVIVLATLAACAAAMSCGPSYHLVGELEGGQGAFPSVSDASPGSTGGVPGGSFDGGTTATDGAGGDAAAVTAFALAITGREAVTRLARVLWETPPDDALLASVDANPLMTSQDVKQLALTMAADPRARVGVGHFYRWWLALDALGAGSRVGSQVSPALEARMADETEAFGAYVTVDGDGRFATLWEAPFSFINEDLAALYGVAGVTGSSLRQVDLGSSLRAGLLTQLSSLIRFSSSDTTTSPTRRGLFVVQRMLCQDIAPPPPDVDFTLMPSSTGPTTMRQRLVAATSDPTCMACHSLFDPVGFGLEKYDGAGRVRLDDSGLPIDDSGSLMLPSGTYPFTGAAALSKAIAAAPEAHRCMSQSWLGYLLGRSVTLADGPAITAINDQFEGAGLDLKTVIAAAASSAAFLDTAGGTPCQPGTPSTCNDDPRISSLHGTCTAAGKCVCAAGPGLNMATGRCL